MTAPLKIPGVYVTELNAFSTPIVEVATAVPAFVGYTAAAADGAKSLRNVPRRIETLAKYREYFGGLPLGVFHVDETNPVAGKAPVGAIALGGKDYLVEPATKQEEQFLLYASICLFFLNGGSDCYIVSVGSYSDTPIASAALIAGIDLLANEPEPTMLVVPDAMHLPAASDCVAVQQHMLLHCGSTMKDRIALLDVYDGYQSRNDPSGDCVQNFRDDIGTDQLDFAAAYYPWLNTSVVGSEDVTYENFDPDDLMSVLRAESILDSKVIDRIKTLSAPYTPQSLNSALLNSSKAYREIVQAALRVLNVLPPSAAIAGVYSKVDDAFGVWKAPANISLTGVASTAVIITDEEQQDLNVDVSGKAINAIRSFPSMGVLIWGARTLDANSSNWRYISVRRTAIMIEQSIQLVLKSYAFSSNTSTTWVAIKSAIENFLTDLWKRGGLAGATPNQAYAVQCGVGETMTATDIPDGILLITVAVAFTRPAEFIVMTFQQQMQSS